MSGGQLDEESLERWLEANVEGFQGPFELTKFPSGQSNPTYRISAASDDYVMRRKPFAGRRPVFVGDDITDESAFAVMPEFHGMGFSVGRRVSGTAHCFPAPSDVRRWLEHLSGGDGTRPQ